MYVGSTDDPRGPQLKTGNLKNSHSPYGPETGGGRSLPCVIRERPEHFGENLTSFLFRRVGRVPCPTHPCLTLVTGGEGSFGRTV